MRRQVAQLGILVPMTLLAVLSEGVFSAIVAGSLIPIAIFQWSVWLYLRSKLALSVELGFNLPTMRDRVDDKLTLAQASSSAALIGMAVVLRGAHLIDPLPRWVFLVVISYVMLMLAVPAIGDLRRWRAVWRPALLRRARQSESLHSDQTK